MITAIVDTFKEEIVASSEDAAEMHKKMASLMAANGSNDLSRINRFEMFCGESVEHILSFFN